MYTVRKEWLVGWAVLPCFKVKMLKGTEGAEMTCGAFLGWIFEYIFAPFWNGGIHITGSYTEGEE